MTEQFQRTQWGYATILCRACKRQMSVLVIERHQREGITCHRCFLKAATAAEVQALCAQIENRQPAGDAEAWEGGDAAA